MDCQSIPVHRSGKAPAPCISCGSPAQAGSLYCPSCLEIINSGGQRLTQHMDDVLAAIERADRKAA